VAERTALQQQQLTAAAPVSEALPERLAALESRLDQAVDLLAALKKERELAAELEQQLAAAQAINVATKRSVEVLAERLAERDRAYEEAAEELARDRAAIEHTQPQPHPETHAAPAAVGPHLVFATVDAAYEIFELDGAIPQHGDTVLVGETEHVVNRVSSAGF